jgi:hypothetical protein
MDCYAHKSIARVICRGDAVGNVERSRAISMISIVEQRGQPTKKETSVMESYQAVENSGTVHA